jgi:hypothetical protein
MITRKKLTKRLWYQDELWDLHTVLSPNKFEDYIILTRKTDSIHLDGKTPATHMIMIDAHNECVYPSNRKVDEIMRRRQKARAEIDSRDDVLTHAWLSLFPRGDWDFPNV